MVTGVSSYGYADSYLSITTGLDSALPSDFLASFFSASFLSSFSFFGSSAFLASFLAASAGLTTSALASFFYSGSLTCACIGPVVLNGV